MTEHIVLIAGPMGAGKTTAVTALSDIPPVRTEAANTERELADKDTTTVALDYGEISIGDTDKVRLYGAPGQRRFDFMWQILTERSEGLLLLIGNDAPDPIGQLQAALVDFADLVNRGAVVVGITRTDLAPSPAIAEHAAAVSAVRPDVLVPVFAVDPRSTDALRTLLLVLIASIESKQAAREIQEPR